MSTAYCVNKDANYCREATAEGLGLRLHMCDMCQIPNFIPMSSACIHVRRYIRTNGHTVSRFHILGVSQI